MAMINPADILRGRILIVDDQGSNVVLLEQMLQGAGYLRLATTMDPCEVSALYAVNDYDLILLDLLMPGMDGFQVMEDLKLIRPGSYLPVIVVTAQPEEKLRALQAGAKDFISKPFELAEVLARVRNLLEVRLLQKELSIYNDVLELRVKERTTDLQNSYLETIFTMTRAAEYKDEDTGAHVKRISFYSRELALMLGLDAAFVEMIFFSSPMHDIGKIGIPDHVLLKPNGFTPDEWEIMKGHSLIGSRILGNSRSPHLRMAAEIALNHHECWDGSGYPGGKRGEEIPLSARIMTIGDIYDALRSKRPYKPALDHHRAMDIISDGDGRILPGHFDPAVLDTFKRNHTTFRDIFDAHAD